MDRPIHREYPLPFHPSDLRLAKDLDPWLARFEGRSADEVAEVLRGEWRAITSPVVASFRDAILRFQPISLFHTTADDPEDWRQGWWLRMHQRIDGFRWDHEVFLHAPPERATLEECLARYGLPERDVMSEFFFYFYTLQSSMEVGCGFYPPDRWLRFEEGGWYVDIDDPDHPDPHREWARAFFLYCDGGGQCALMKESGEVGWYLAPEIRMCPLASSFSNFVEQCAICYKDRGGLDYYNNWVERFSRE
jgi:hypothetical protein